jgi:DNA-binding transcriptional MerR regulator
MPLMTTLQQACGEMEDCPALEDRILALREKGMTFKAVGEALGLTPSRTRNLYLRACSRRAGRKPAWTDGLNQRLANCLRWLEFSSREEVAQALRSGHLRRLAACERSLNAAALEELEQWLASDRCEESDTTA